MPRTTAAIVASTLLGHVGARTPQPREGEPPLPAAAPAVPEAPEVERAPRGARMRWFFAWLRLVRT
jgi:hypothetical protein